MPIMTKSAPAAWQGRGSLATRAYPSYSQVPLEICLVMLAVSVSYGVPLVIGTSLTLTVAVALSVALPGLITIFLIKSSIRLFTLFWVTLALMQNFFSGLWVSRTATAIPVYVTEQKTVSVLVACLVSIEAILLFLAARPRLAAAFGVYFFAVVIATRGVDAGALAYARNFMVPLLLVVLFASLVGGWSVRARLGLAMTMTQLVTAVLSAGLVAEFLAGTDTWRRWLRADISGALNSLSDSTWIFGFKLSRFAGFVIEPTNAGYIAAAALIVSLVIWVKYRQGENRVGNPLLTAIPAAICLVASGAKSGFLMFLIAAIVLLVFRVTRSITAGFILGWLSAFLVVFVYVAKVKGVSAAFASFSDPIAIVGGDSTTFHLAGLLSGLRSAVENPQGAGLGVGGNFNRNNRDSWSVWLGTGSESAWGTLSYQLGLLGLTAFLVVLILLGRHLGRTAAVLLCAWSSAGLFAEALFGPQVAGVLMIASALLGEYPTSTKSEIAAVVPQKALLTERGVI